MAPSRKTRGESTGETRSSRNTTRSSLVRFLSMKSQHSKTSISARQTNARGQSAKTSKANPMKTSKVGQCQYTVHCLLGYTYILSKHHVSSRVSDAPAKHHMPFHQTASRKTPHICFQQNIFPRVCFSKTSSHETVFRKHHMTQPSLPQTQKFPLQSSLAHSYWKGCPLRLLHSSAVL